MLRDPRLGCEVTLRHAGPVAMREEFRRKAIPVLSFGELGERSRPFGGGFGVHQVRGASAAAAS